MRASRVPNIATVVIALMGVALFGACSSVSKSMRNVSQGKTATISRSSLSAIPCVKDAAQSTYGVTSDVDYDRLQYGATNTTPGIGPPSRFVLYLNQKQENTDTRTRPTGPSVRFEFWDRSAASTGVRYWIDAPESDRAALEEKALAAIEQCGGSSEMKRGI